MNGSLLDILLVLLALLFAINGYRQGFVIGGLSFVGFFGGALFGVQLAPFVVGRFANPSGQVLVALVTVFGLAVLGQIMAAWLGSRIRRSINNKTFRVFDDIGGAIVSVLAVLLVTWMVAAPLGSSSVPWIADQVRNSAIVRTVNGAMPDPVRSVYGRLRQAVDTNGFPDVFGDLAPTRERSVEPPDPALAKSPVVQNAQRSTVKVLGEARKCSRRIEGTGFVYAPERVMTNAHVVAGTEKVNVEIPGERTRSARVVVYDARKDLAVLHVPGMRAPAMSFAPREAVSGQDAIVVGYPLDGPYRATPARVRDVRVVRGPDIYDSATPVQREVYSLRARVQSGNSGGPLLAPDGTVYGVIFAAAADDPDTGFALSRDEAAPVAGAGATATAGVGTGSCT